MGPRRLVVRLGRMASIRPRKSHHQRTGLWPEPNRSEPSVRLRPLAHAVAAIKAAIGGRVAVAIVAALHLVLAPLPAAAQQSLPVVRDAETEALMRDYLMPIMRAAKVPGGTAEVVLVKKRDFNAFVVDSKRIFVNTGVLADAETPNEVVGVLAHETGHIAGGHMARMREAMGKAQLIAALGVILGAGAIAAGGVTGNSDIGSGGIVAMSGGMQVAQRSLLAYQRGEEEAADRAALKFLERTQQSPKGMLTVFARFADQMLVAARYADPYAQSHPMPRDRLVALTERAKASPYFEVKDAPALQARHDLMRAKLIAFTDNPTSVQRRYPANDASLPATYAHAILAYRLGDPASAQRHVDVLLKAQPNNPYFWELKGQVLLESGKPKEAVAPLRKAVALAPQAALIRIMLGEALAATNDPALVDEAIAELNRGVAAEPNAGLAYRHLAGAYARRGDIGLADLATARGMFADGDVANARRYAARAQKTLKTGSPAWLQADDIVSYKPPKL